MDSYATIQFDVPRSLLISGENIIAVELHNAKGSSSIVFDMSLFDYNTGSSVLNSSSNQNYTANVTDKLVLKAVYEKDLNWVPSEVKLFINEICASNNQYVDEYRQDEDWIEIYNDGTSPVDLAGMYISDKRKDLTRFQIPTGYPEKTTVPAKGYLIIWADADSSSQGPLHTNFKLSKLETQTISLSRNVNGTIEVIDSIRYNIHNEGQSYSRFSYADNGAWCVTARPTFAAKNAYFPMAESESNPEETDNTLTDSNGIGVLSVYPNPVEDYLWFNFENGQEGWVSISDLSGRILISKKLRSGESISVRNLTSGIYVANVLLGKKQFERRFVKF
jgi:hypothetical protein